MMSTSCARNGRRQLFESAPPGADTFPPGKRVRHRLDPGARGVVLGIVTEECWGGTFTTLYRVAFGDEVALPGGLGTATVERTRLVEPALLEADPDDAPGAGAPEGPCAPPKATAGDIAEALSRAGEGAGDHLHPRPFGIDVPHFLSQGPELVSMDGRFAIRKDGDTYTAEDRRNKLHTRGLFTQQAAELWCAFRAADVPGAEQREPAPF